MDFVRSHLGKMHLWPVEHYFPPFFSRSALIWKKRGKKCSTGQRFIFSEVLTSYEIHTLNALVSIFLIKAGYNIIFERKPLWKPNKTAKIRYFVTVFHFEEKGAQMIPEKSFSTQISIGLDFCSKSMTSVGDSVKLY